MAGKLNVRTNIIINSILGIWRGQALHPDSAPVGQSGWLNTRSISDLVYSLLLSFRSLFYSLAMSRPKIQVRNQ